MQLSEGVEQKGLQKGIQQALTESIKNLMDTMNMTAKEAMDALKIKEEERSPVCGASEKTKINITFRKDKL